jgi:hypothetical protein
MTDRPGMKRSGSILCVALALIASCEARNPSPAFEKVAAEEAPLIEEAALEELAPKSYGLQLIDYDDGILVEDSGPRDQITGLAPPAFALRCNVTESVLEVSAPARQLGDRAVAGSARLVVSELEFPGEVAVANAGQSADMRLPLTPELLAAIATTVNARLVVGAASARSNSDTNGTFPGFAGQCSLKSGVRLPPP